MTPLYTALDGALERRTEGWFWRDGQAAAAVSDLLLNRCAPNFRCITYGSGTYVEVPHDWRARRYWPGARLDTEAAAAIAELLRDLGRQHAVYAEGLAEALDDHRLSKRGHLIPVAHWDAVFMAPCGATWLKEDEAEILARAQSLGWRA